MKRGPLAMRRRTCGLRRQGRDAPGPCSTNDCSCLMHNFVLFSGACVGSTLQAPRFITPPSASGSIVAEGRTKILQCQALGKRCSPYSTLLD